MRYRETTGKAFALPTPLTRSSCLYTAQRAAVARSKLAERGRTPMADRDFDIVIYGATGFVGRLAAEYLAGRAGKMKLRWAIAGRDRERLAKVAERSGGKPKVLVADSSDAKALHAIAGLTRVMMNMAGP